eukprot:70633_1
MGSGSGKELESEDTPDTETNYTSPANINQPKDIVQSAPHDIHDKKIKHVEPVKYGSLCDEPNKPKISFAEVKEEEIADLNYINTSSEEINKQKQLCLTHISHRGHFSSNCQWSAQNLFQNNDAQYMSLKTHNFDSNYNKCDHDWIICKINSLHSIKITQLLIYFSNKNEIKQYPFKICMQFMLTNDLKRVINSANDNCKWSMPYYILPSIFESTKPESKHNQHMDTFTLSFAAQYLDELYNNKYHQYVRISFIQSHGNIAKNSKFCLKHLRLFGVPLLDDNNEIIDLEINISNEKQYKYEIENKYNSNLQPKPGKEDCRVLMRQHMFFVNVGHKTINVLKNMICEEYDRLNQGNDNYNKYNAKGIFLIVDGYGLVNDMMDTSVLNKTLSQIGAKQGKHNTGYYIIVGFC